MNCVIYTNVLVDLLPNKKINMTLTLNMFQVQLVDILKLVTHKIVYYFKAKVS